MYRDTKEWIKIYQKRGALWMHDGNPLRPHALLTGGQHSGGFFNSRLIIADEVLLNEGALDLLDLFAEEVTDLSEIGCVVGPQTGATKLAKLICRQINVQTNGDYQFASPAKGQIGQQKTMSFTDEEVSLVTGQTVLLCEDVLTTGGSVELAATAVENVGGHVLPYVLVLVNRSGLMEVGGRKIISLIDRYLPTYDADKCPLCELGSEALLAKNNWEKLNAEY